MTDTEIKQYSLAEIATHNSNKSAWIVIHNNIYDVTAFLNEVCILVYKFIIFFIVNPFH